MTRSLLLLTMASACTMRTDASVQLPPIDWEAAERSQGRSTLDIDGRLSGDLPLLEAFDELGSGTASLREWLTSDRLSEVTLEVHTTNSNGWGMMRTVLQLEDGLAHYNSKQGVACTGPEVDWVSYDATVETTHIQSTPLFIDGEPFVELRMDLELFADRDVTGIALLPVAEDDGSAER